MKRLFLVVLALLVLAGCARRAQTDNTSADSSGRVTETSSISETSTSSTALPSADTSAIVTEELFAQGPNGQIYGKVTAPQNYKETQLPTIIYSHGFGGRAESADKYADSLARAGYVVYSFDFMGGNRNSRSGNDILKMSVFTEQDDLTAVLSMIKEQTFVDKKHIFLMGESQGGVVSTMTAAEHQEDIRGMILIYPAFVLFDDARELFSSVDQIPEVYNHRGNDVGKVYFEKSLDYDIFNTMKRVTKPVLIVHGTADSIAPISYSERAVQTFADAQLVSLPGEEHFFSNAGNQTAVQETIAFVEKNRS